MNDPQFFIIGASGLIGSALFKKLSKTEKVLGTYNNNYTPNLKKFDLEINKYDDFFNSIDENSVIYLMSAYSNPNWIYLNQKKTLSLNYNNTIKLFDYINKFKSHIIFMSSVEVFDGIEGSYKETNIPNPLNYYGKLKYAVEEYLIKNIENYTIVRTGWNVGYNNSERCVVRLTYDTILKEKAFMANDNFFSIIDVEDSSEALKLLGKVNYNKPKIVNICSDEIINRYELAQFIKNNSRAGKKMNFEECLFDDIKYSEPRGKINNLDNNLSKKILKINYKNAYDVILKKIKYIDSLYGY
ncbi:sugar nucleotide-binding protein [Alphaproteobacteria bacterium]|nr:sugar nucleotide-binding protein [Alphaproteobacteria bacterium]